MKTLIKNGHLVDPSQHLDAVKDLLVENGRIARIADHIEDPCDEVYDASGLVVAPGFIDIHTHMRDPGYEAKEDLVSGTMAAAAGGITRVACMPNTKPVIDSAILVSGVKKRAEEEGYVHVEVIGAITKGEKGQEITEMGDMALRGAMAFSDDGHFVENPNIMLLAARYAGSFDKAQKTVLHQIFKIRCLGQDTVYPCHRIRYQGKIFFYHLFFRKSQFPDMTLRVCLCLIGIFVCHMFPA